MTIDDMWSLVDLNDYTYEDAINKLNYKDQEIIRNYILKLKDMLMQQSDLAEQYLAIINNLEKKFNSIGLSLNIKNDKHK